MKLNLNKKKLKNLSKDAQILPNDMTPQVGAGFRESAQSPCRWTHVYVCGPSQAPIGCDASKHVTVCT
ncbi:hypothetical protein [Pseudoalteromonas denitrificans]|uniref:Uncharacterized protein n=1 Tax=Pseudoalteromonas denitrificans DSM 6059 TaxID=1123010 RepID=A0A1I1RT88_9GAMM|nr:hypothetical protein [Pseudoalteromonas denitrificans]SFD34833.1 hypothetical protein SAMN02745724_04272 [Pseudoalteromonas denitrificans DSM 6059]